MLKELKNSGLPIYMNEENGLLALSAPFVYKGFAQKKLSDMHGLFKDDSNHWEDEPIYDVYRGILDPAHSGLFEKYKFQYDITVVRGGLIGNESKKTSGHYHSWNEMNTSTYPEVYEVISGTAVYILQRADNFKNTDFENLHVSDLIAVRVYAGQAIIIPPNYGHCSVNGGEGPLVFSNLAYTPCTVDYAPVKYYHGLGAYVGYKDGRLMIEKNRNYKNLPRIKYAQVKENKDLGIVFNKPVYRSFKENPEAFDFLGNVDPYREQIMNMLDRKEELV